MATFSPPQEAINFVDPRMRINEKQVQVIETGAKNNTYRVISADSSLSVNTVNFNYNATSVHDVIDRRFLIKYYINVVITGTGNPLTAYGTSDSLRFLPINSSTTSLQLTINNSNQSVIPFRWLDAISRFIKMSDLKNDLSASPSCPDLVYDYALGTGPKNVMGGYSDNSVNSPDLRGSLVPISSSEGNGTSTFKFEVIEPLFVPPLAYQDRDVDGFTGVESLSLQLSHDWAGPNLWSHAVGTTLSTFAVTMYNTPQLLLNVLTPNELVQPYNPLKTYVYNNFSMRHYSTDVGAIVAGASENLNSGNIQLNCIPNRIYVFARKRKQDKTVSDPDVFARINSINVSLGNKTSLLGFATSRDLYKISVRNGYQYSYNAWNSFQGGVLCLKPAQDLSLDLGEAPGLVVQKQLQISMNVSNQTAFNQSYEMIVVPVLPGAFYISDGVASQSVGLLKPEQIINAPESRSVMNNFVSEHINADVYGSGIFDILRQAFKFALPIVAPVVGDLASKGIDYVSKSLRSAVDKRRKKYSKRGRGVYGHEAFEEMI